jgi:amidase
MFKEYDQYDATGLAGLVAKGEVTPGELLETAWARIEGGEPKLNAIADDDGGRGGERLCGAA